MNQAFRVSTFSLVTAACALVCSAGAKEIDLRNLSEPDNGYGIEFCARPTDAKGRGFGHAFVVFRSSDDFLAVGFSPEYDKKSLLPAPGVLREENFSHENQTCLKAHLTSRQYSALREWLEKQQNIDLGPIRIPVRRQFWLLQDDCVKFMQAAARQLGLTVPTRLEGITPMQMVEALIRNNPT